MVKLVFYLLYCCAAIKSCGLSGIRFKAIPHRMFAVQVCHVAGHDEGKFVITFLQQTAQLKRLRGPETDPGRLTVDKSSAISSAYTVSVTEWRLRSAVLALI